MIDWIQRLWQRAGSALKSASLPLLRAAADPAVRMVELAARSSLSRLERMQAAQLEQLAGMQATQLATMDQRARAWMETVQRTVAGQLAFTAGHASILHQLARERDRSHWGTVPPPDLPGRIRAVVRKHAGLPPAVRGDESEDDLLAELRFLWENSALVRPMLELAAGRRVLYAGQCYYNLWYLSRALRERGWKADLLNWDANPASQIYYHGEDFRFSGLQDELVMSMRFYVEALYGYDVFHFSNAHGLSFGWALGERMASQFGDYGEIYLLKELGKKVVYTNNGCLDGVAQSSFSKWGPESSCAICRWRNEPSVCGDELNLTWGRFRNSVADYQCLLGGNRVDYNDDPRIHESPWVYCLDPEFWKPEIAIPEQFRVNRRSESTLLLYHAVGNKPDRTLEGGINIKSTHVYLPLVRKLQEAGWDLQLIEPVGVPNRDVRYLQAQADIFLEMLTFGWFGANAREAMMLGKPVICYIRPEWLESLRQELPEYAAELPIVTANPDSIEEVLIDLISNPSKRDEIGRRSREFMLRWHSAEAAATHFDEIYQRLIRGEPLLRGAAPAAGQ